jgi:HlyD family secretion protein
MKRTWLRLGWRQVLISLGGLAVVGALVWAFSPRPVLVEVATVVQGRFESRLDEEGKTRVRERYVVATPLGGQLERIVWKEGDVVRAGDVLALVRPALPQLQDERTRRELTAREASANAARERAEARVARTGVAQSQARLELDRTQTLAREGFVSPVSLETSRLALRASEQEARAAQAERHMADHEWQQARAALELSLGGNARRSDAFRVTAPSDGRVLRIVAGSEAQVPAGSALIEVGDTEQLEVVADMLSTDVVQFGKGSAAVVEGFGNGAPLQAQVARIEPAAVTKVSALGVEEQRVRVVLEITSPRRDWPELGDGFRVSVGVITQAVEQAVQVPVSAVYPLPLAQAPVDGQALNAPRPEVRQHAVFVLHEGRVRQQAVQVGARSGGMAWIHRGLSPGESVLIYPPPSLRDGARVRVRST